MLRRLSCRRNVLLTSNRCGSDIEGSHAADMLEDDGGAVELDGAVKLRCAYCRKKSKNTESEVARMKIMVIGATGNLGSRVVRRALDAGHEVVALVRGGSADTVDVRASVRRGDLFALDAADLDDVDVLVSAFGSGFSSDPSANRDAFARYLELTGEGAPRDVQLISIAGEGVLYTDTAHTQHRYETEGYSKRLYPISRYTSEGVDLLERSAKRHWTVVCPAGTFDPEGPATEDVVLGCDREPVENADGNRYVSYEDLAAVMVSLVGSTTHDGQVVTVASRRTPLARA